MTFIFLKKTIKELLLDEKINIKYLTKDWNYQFIRIGDNFI